MPGCCANKEADLLETARKHRSLLWSVLIINLIMFFVEGGMGLLAGSVALMGDSLDMLGDAITYGSSLAVVGMALPQKAKVAKLKAWIMLISGLTISAQCFYRGFNPQVPELGLMLGVGVLALVMNLICLFLLTKHKDDDINMRSVWICSRNDIIANTSVLVAAGLVWWTTSPYPDLAVGIALSFLFTRSAAAILSESRAVRSETEPDLQKGCC